MTASNTRDRLTTTLASAPWNLVPAQAADLCAWLAGLSEGLIAGLGSLTDGEIAACAARIEGCTDPAALVDEWFGARLAAHAPKTPEQLDEEAAQWLY